MPLLIFVELSDKMNELVLGYACVHHLHPYELGRVRCTHLSMRNPEGNVQGTPCASFGQWVS